MVMRLPAGRPGSDVDAAASGELASVLSALTTLLGAWVSVFVPAAGIGQDGRDGDQATSAAAMTRSHTTQAVTDGQLRSWAGAARTWLGTDAAESARLRIAGAITDVAVVGSVDGVLHGALAVVRSTHDRTDRATAAAELELAAALVAGLLDGSGSSARRRLIEWGTAQSAPRTVFAVAVDRLGTVNTVMGRRAGDAVLAALAARLDRWAAPHGRAVHTTRARYLVLRTDIHDDTEAVRAAHLLRDLLAGAVDVGGVQVSRSASIGISLDASGEVPVGDLVDHAVRACASARMPHSGGVVTFAAADVTARLDRLRLELDLHAALVAGDLRMHYQPEYDLRSGRMVAVEALLRWQHPERGLLAADTFVPAAEHTYTFGAVQRWAVDEACRQLGAWSAAGLADDLVVRVNVTAAQLSEGGLGREIVESMRRHDVAGAQLCLELTERHMPRHPDGLADELQRLRATGIRIAVDDFGTGEGTLRHLLDLPIDSVKLDQSFVGPMTSDARAAAVVSHTVGLARSLDLDVIAEGVSSSATVAALLGAGCERGQGNFLAPAMSADELGATLTGRS